MTSDEAADAAAASVLDRRFDIGSLSALRALTRASAAQAGMPAERVTDVVIALHELAANVIRHGAGWGRLRIWDHLGALHCRVDDDGPATAQRRAARGDAGMEGVSSAGQNLADRWPRDPGHGLWLAEQVADQMTLRSDSRGTSAVITFSLPALADPLRARPARGAGYPWLAGR